MASFLLGVHVTYFCPYFGYVGRPCYLANVLFSSCLVGLTDTCVPNSYWPAVRVLRLGLSMTKEENGTATGVRDLPRHGRLMSVLPATGFPFHNVAQSVLLFSMRPYHSSLIS